MKKHLLILVLIAIIFELKSQSVYFGTGKTIAKLTFKNEQGEKLKGTKGSNESTFHLGMRTPLFRSAFHISGDASYQHYFAFGSDPSVGNYYEWDGIFAGANLGLDYELFKPNFAYYKKNGISVSLKAMFTAEFLIDGTQNFNNHIYDLNKAPEYKEPFYFARGGLCLNYYFSKEIVVMLQYLGGKSFMLSGTGNKQQVSYITHSLTVGASYNFFYQNNGNTR